VARKQCVLSDPGWKTIPWRLTKKTLKEILVDILVDLPTLLEDVDVMAAMTDPGTKQIQKETLASRVWVFDKRLTDWYLSVPLPRELGMLDIEDADSMRAEDLTLAHIMTLYWCTCLVLYRTMTEVVEPDFVLPEHADSSIYCKKIIQAIPIFLHPVVGTYRVHLATFPMGLCMNYLARCDPHEMTTERALLASYFRRPEGATMKSFVSNIQLEALEEISSKRMMPFSQDLAT